MKKGFFGSVLLMMLLSHAVFGQTPYQHPSCNLFTSSCSTNQQCESHQPHPYGTDCKVHICKQAEATCQGPKGQTVTAYNYCDHQKIPESSSTPPKQ